MALRKSRIGRMPVNEKAAGFRDGTAKEQSSANARERESRRLRDGTARLFILMNDRKEKIMFGMSRIYLRRIVMLLLCLLFILLGATIVNAEVKPQNRTVRAGIFSHYGYHMRNSEGHLTGYGIDFLNMASKYSHLNFEYVGYDKSWDEMLEMLEKGEIDVLTSARKLPEHEEKYAFSFPIGKTSTVLSVKAENKRFHSEDYETYDGMKIGLLMGSRQNQRLKKFADEKGFSYKAIEYENSYQLALALKGGNIDAILTSDLRKTEDERTLDTLVTEDFYAIVRKEDTDLLYEINYAISQIDANEGDWSNDLLYKYYGPVYSSGLTFTDRENEYIQDVISGNKSITVTALGDRCPYSYVEDGELKGIMPDFFDEVMKLTGMKYEMIVPEDRTDYYKLAGSNGVDVVIDKRTDNVTSEDNLYNGFSTDAYITVGVAKVTRANFSGNIKTVAIADVQGNVPLEEKLLGDADVLICKTREEALQAVLDGKADAAYVYTYTAQQFVNNDLSGTLNYSIVNGVRFEFKMYVRDSSDHELVTILNKCIRNMPDEVISRLITEYTTNAPRDLTFAEYMRFHPGMVFLGTFVIASLMVMIFVLCLRARWNKKILCAAEKSNKELGEQLAIVDALSRDYLNVFAINTKENIAKIVKMDGYVTLGLKQGSDEVFQYDIILHQYIEDRVYADDRQNLKEALSLEKVTRKLDSNSEYMGSYRVMIGEEIHNFQFTYVKLESEGVKKGFRVLAGFRNIDEAVREEKKQKEMLAEALEEARYANHAKTIFLNNMSHDIRTPMNAIIGFTTLAAKHIDDKDLVQNYLDKIMTSGRHLLSLINDVLDMSRIESGKVVLEEKEASLSEIMYDLNTIVQSDVKAKQIKFDIDMVDVVNETVICDKLRLNQVLLNILSNAVKYTKPGGTVSTRIIQTSEELEGYASYQFKVKDTGIGMSEEFLKHIFEPFEREQTSTISGIQGTGLGLTITKNIIDMMNGCVEVESEEGKGTEFTVSFRFRTTNSSVKPGYLQSERADNEDSKVSAELFAGKKILLAEDNELNQEIAKAILEEAGFVIDIVNDGTDAVDTIKRAPADSYDLILMDIQMPVMDGYEASRKIRALDDKARASIPIIAMTANAFEEDRKNAIDAGMNGHIAKPIDVEKLMETLKDIFDK